MPARRFTAETSEFDYARAARRRPERRISRGRRDPGHAVPATVRTYDSTRRECQQTPAAPGTAMPEGRGEALG